MPGPAKVLNPLLTITYRHSGYPLCTDDISVVRIAVPIKGGNLVLYGL